MNGKFTLLVDKDGALIEIHDKISSQRIVRVKLTPEEYCQALSRLVHIECNLELGHLDRIGKKMVMDKLIFPMPKCEYQYEKEIAGKEAILTCPVGWVPDLYFGSKDSFFEKDDVKYARTTIRQWIVIDENENIK